MQDNSECSSPINPKGWSHDENQQVSIEGQRSDIDLNVVSQSRKLYEIDDQFQQLAQKQNFQLINQFVFQNQQLIEQIEFLERDIDLKFLEKANLVQQIQQLKRNNMKYQAILQGKTKALQAVTILEKVQKSQQVTKNHFEFVKKIDIICQEQEGQKIQQQTISSMRQFFSTNLNLLKQDIEAKQKENKQLERKIRNFQKQLKAMQEKKKRTQVDQQIQLAEDLINNQQKYIRKLERIIKKYKGK